ncbi:MAG: PfkB family carbohydrate kinase [Myxococcota bacterium]
MDVVVEPSRLVELIERFAGRRALVLGDPVVDQYIYGTTHRISREAPVLIVREDGREARLGGAANAAANVASLGAQTSFAGLVGEDPEALELSRLFDARGIDTRLLYRSRTRSTVTKTRILAGGVHTTKQQMLRIDRESEGPLTPADEARLVEGITAVLPEVDALIISDYGAGDLGGAYAAIAKQARATRKIVVVDSRYELQRFSGVTAVTPNAPEAAEALGESVDAPLDAARGAQRLMHRLDLEAVILTRGREGMVVADRQGAPVLLDAHGHKEAVDVTGAGDTVTATFSLGLAVGASVLEAAILANCAAAVVVQSIGATAITPGELSAAVRTFDRASLRRVKGL